MYPKLERFEINYPVQCYFQLKKFFKLNSNVHCFAAYFPLIWANRKWLMTSGVKFNDLAIKVDEEDFESDYWFGSNVTIEIFCNLIKELYERGMYSRLHLYINFMDRDQFEKRELMDRILMIPALYRVFGNVRTR